MKVLDLRLAWLWLWARLVSSDFLKLGRSINVLDLRASWLVPRALLLSSPFLKVCRSEKVADVRAWLLLRTRLDWRVRTGIIGCARAFAAPLRRTCAGFGRSDRSSEPLPGDALSGGAPGLRTAWKVGDIKLSPATAPACGGSLVLMGRGLRRWLGQPTTPGLDRPSPSAVRPGLRTFVALGLGLERRSVSTVSTGTRIARGLDSPPPSAVRPGLRTGAGCRSGELTGRTSTALGLGTAAVSAVGPGRRVWAVCWGTLAGTAGVGRRLSVAPLPPVGLGRPSGAPFGVSLQMVARRGGGSSHGTGRMVLWLRRLLLPQDRPVLLRRIVELLDRLDAERGSAVKDCAGAGASELQRQGTFGMRAPWVSRTRDGTRTADGLASVIDCSQPTAMTVLDCTAVVQTGGHPN